MSAYLLPVLVSFSFPLEDSLKHKACVVIEADIQHIHTSGRNFSPAFRFTHVWHMSTWVSDQHRQFTATTSAPGESFLTRPLPKMPVSVFHHSSNRLTPNLRSIETALSHPHTQFINNSCWLYSQKISTTSHHTQGCHLSLVGCPLSSHLICSLLHYCAL